MPVRPSALRVPRFVVSSSRVRPLPRAFTGRWLTKQPRATADDATGSVGGPQRTKWRRMTYSQPAWLVSEEEAKKAVERVERHELYIERAVALLVALAGVAVAFLVRLV